MEKKQEPKSEAVHIAAFEVENVKRVKAVAVEVNDESLVVIGGDNGQGKTSLLDAMMWTLGGDRLKPSDPLRKGSDKLATKVTLSNGITVERRGKNGTLTVKSKEGLTGNQSLLNQFIEAMALDLSGFMNQSDADKAKTLLKIIGVDLSELDKLEKDWKAQRLVLGREADRTRAYADGLPKHADAPKEEQSITDISAQMQEAVLKNEANAKFRSGVTELKARIDETKRLYSETEAKIFGIEEQLRAARALLRQYGEGMQRASDRHLEACNMSSQLVDIDTAVFQTRIATVETDNAKVRANAAKEAANTAAMEAARAHSKVDGEIDILRQKRLELLANAKMPLDGLTVNDDGALLYKEQLWDCMSHSEQLKVATAIVRKLNPKCGFVLIDKVEAMDTKTLKQFGEWLKQEGLQAICTRVSTGKECTLIIEDGSIKKDEE